MTANATGTTIGDTIKVGVNLELTGTVAAYGNAETTGLNLLFKRLIKLAELMGKKLSLLQKITSQKMQKLQPLQLT